MKAGERKMPVSDIKFCVKKEYTILDNNFIDNYMASAPSPVYALVYIYALRCGSSGLSVSNKHIAEKLGVLESDVINAWKYWKSKELVRLGGNKENPVVEFIFPDTVKNTESKKTERVKIITSKPNYSPGDIAGILDKSMEARELLEISEKLMARPLTPRESEILIWMYDSLELSIDVIIVLVTYCANNSKPIRYMEKTAMDWAERDISTSEAAAEYLSIFTSYGKVLKFYGISDRGPSSADKKYIDRWILDFKMPLEVIEIACSKTIENTGKAAFSYTDKIIENWHKNNIRTVKAVEKADSEFTGRAEKSGKAADISRQKNPFTNYEQKIYSDEEIEKIIARKKANKYE